MSETRENPRRTGKRVRILHDRVTVKHRDGAKSGPGPFAHASGDVSRQNIAGKNSFPVTNTNALFFLADIGREKPGVSFFMRELRCFYILFLSVILAAACGEPPPANTGSASAREVIDDLGRKVTVPAKITRAISLAPNLTENVFAVGAGDRLVGVTSFCNYPEAAKSIAKIGDTLNPNMESIVALKPEIVLVSTASQIEAFSSTLAANGIAVYVTNPDSVDAMFRNLEQLGSLFGTSAKADELVNSLRNRLKKLEARRSTMPADRVFVQISKEPLFTIGKQSFLTAALEKIGAISVTNEVETAYPKLSKETALALKPEVLILSESNDNREPNTAFAASPAIRKGNVIKVNADIISRPGPRLIDALELIEAELGRIKFAGEANN